jgi:GTPase SAR1 family protein
MTNPRLVVVADGGCGQTSIIIRFIRDIFLEGYTPTLEAHSKSIHPSITIIPSKFESTQISF